MRLKRLCTHRGACVWILMMAAVALALAACGGNATSAGSVTDKNQSQAEFQACMNKEAGPRPSGPPDPAMAAKIQAAAKDCEAKTGYRIPSFQNQSDQQKQAQLQQALKLAACMRQHGVNMPDPTINDQGISIPSGGADPNSPAFQEAFKACQGVLPSPSPILPSGG
jgi:hypothetical protein